MHPTKEQDNSVEFIYVKKHLNIDDKTKDLIMTHSLHPY